MSHHHHHHTDSSMRMGWAFFLNFIFTIIEFIGGFLTNSTAIMADAIHDLGDTLSIGMAWVLNKLGNKDATTSFTYGYRRLSLVGALINAVILVAGSIWILIEAIPRLWNPVMPLAEGMLGLAVLGITVNGFAAYQLSKGKSLNERVLNWHLLEDVLGWVAVLVVAIVLMFVDWPILDPILSIGFTLFILANISRHLYETLRLFVQGAPSKDLYHQVAKKLKAVTGVVAVHHLHLWSLDGEHHVCTAHLEVTAEADLTSQRRLKEQVAEALEPFNFAHTTIELELPDEPCRDL